VFVIKLGTAKVLGCTVAQSLLIAVDQRVE
jgi:hypothetical protein